ncbi:unnamed protein product [Cylicocyclus nassatus]|uniref:Peptidase S1 domain-containing protein n=1 Tax=Cylicocyclus nassatus TaxID=53992 RepID=A0AA36MB70_CYLNA|nr:unnamed protein product [Cylicocyclus nassatus]
MHIILFCLLCFLENIDCRKLTEKENEKLRGSCGKKDRRAYYKVFGGLPVKPNEYPFFVSLRYDLGRKGEELCGGSLISPYHVLTAAHCIIKSSNSATDVCGKPPLERKFNFTYNTLVNRWRIYIGSKCRHVEKCIKPLTFDRIFVRLDYDECSHAHDLAIITLRSKVGENAGIPICLPERRQVLRKFLSAVGAGYDPTQKTRDKFFGGLQKASLLAFERDDFIETKGRFSALCSGDSGGPLLSSYEGRFVLLGIASAVYPSCAENADYRLNRYVDVRKYLDWICKHTGVCPKHQDQDDEEND